MKCYCYCDGGFEYGELVVDVFSRVGVEWDEGEIRGDFVGVEFSE